MNPQPPGYEPDELPIALPRDQISELAGMGIEPTSQAHEARLCSPAESPASIGGRPSLRQLDANPQACCEPACSGHRDGVALKGTALGFEPCLSIQALSSFGLSHTNWLTKAAGRDTRSVGNRSVRERPRLVLVAVHFWD